MTDFHTQAQSLTPNPLITLYELSIDGEVLRFHGHNQGVINWQGNDYEPIAMTADGLEMRGDGKASTPTLTLANVYNGMAGGISALCMKFNDFAGAKLTVTHAFMDTQDYKTAHWYVEQKTEETHAQVSFELSNPIDWQGRKIPVRQITAYCAWAVTGGYRGESCGYTGTACFDKNGEPCDKSKDACRGLLYDCQLRFGENGELPFGGFPASSLL